MSCVKFMILSHGNGGYISSSFAQVITPARFKKGNVIMKIIGFVTIPPYNRIGQQQCMEFSTTAATFTRDLRNYSSVETFPDIGFMVKRLTKNLRTSILRLRSLAVFSLRRTGFTSNSIARQSQPPV